MSTAEEEEDWIGQRLAAGEAAFRPGRANVYFFPTCRWCEHEWHGLRCKGCACESSHGHKDDSWRPHINQGSFAERVRLLAHETGVDGWTARVAAAPYGHRVRAWLYGRLA